MDVQLTDGHTDIQHETLMPRHYRVAGYKKSVQIMMSAHKMHRWVLGFKSIYKFVIIPPLN